MFSYIQENVIDGTGGSARVVLYIIYTCQTTQLSVCQIDIQDEVLGAYKLLLRFFFCALVECSNTSLHVPEHCNCLHCVMSCPKKKWDWRRQDRLSRRPQRSHEQKLIVDCLTFSQLLHLITSTRNKTKSYQKDGIIDMCSNKRKKAVSLLELELLLKLCSLDIGEIILSMQYGFNRFLLFDT